LPRAVPPPATFRLQGLATLWAACSLQARAGFISHRQRSWDSPFGAFSSRKVSAAFPGGRTHVPFHLSVIPPPKRWAGPTGRGFWALTLPRVPGAARRISAAALDAPMGFALLGFTGESLARVFAQAPPAHFTDANLTTGARGCLGVSIGLCRVPPTASGKPDRESGTTLLGFSHRTRPGHLSESSPGL